MKDWILLITGGTALLAVSAVSIQRWPHVVHSIDSEGGRIEKFVDSSGVLHGSFTRWYPSGELNVKIQYDHGIQICSEFYLENGLLICECWEQNYEWKCRSITGDGIIVSSGK